MLHLTSYLGDGVFSLLILIGLDAAIKSVLLVSPIDLLDAASVSIFTSLCLVDTLSRWAVWGIDVAGEAMLDATEPSSDFTSSLFSSSLVEDIPQLPASTSPFFLPLLPTGIGMGMGMGIGNGMKIGKGRTNVGGGRNEEIPLLMFWQNG